MDIAPISPQLFNLFFNLAQLNIVISQINIFQFELLRAPNHIPGEKLDESMDTGFA